MQNEQLSMVDVLAMQFLKDFIKENFPSPEPEKQVAVAYLYASLMTSYRQSREEHPMERLSCPECGSSEMKCIDVSTLESPGATLIVCAKCGHRMMK